MKFKCTLLLICIFTTMSCASPVAQRQLDFSDYLGTIKTIADRETVLFEGTFTGKLVMRQPIDIEKINYRSFKPEPHPGYRLAGDIVRTIGTFGLGFLAYKTTESFTEALASIADRSSGTSEQKPLYNIHDSFNGNAGRDIVSGNPSSNSSTNTFTAISDSYNTPTVTHTFSNNQFDFSRNPVITETTDSYNPDYSQMYYGY